MSDVKERTVKGLALAAALAALCACRAPAARAQQRAEGDAHARDGRGAPLERGTLAEIKDKRAAMLVVGRSFAVDARAPSEVSAEDVRTMLDAPRPRVGLNAYRVIGARLNRYIRRYHSLTSVETRADADFFVVFEIMQERHSLIDGRPFSYGKLFVVTLGAGGTPRILWESKGDMLIAEDAAGDLIKALKESRGER